MGHVIHMMGHVMADGSCDLCDVACDPCDGSCDPCDGVPSKPRREGVWGAPVRLGGHRRGGRGSGSHALRRDSVRQTHGTWQEGDDERECVCVCVARNVAPHRCYQLALIISQYIVQLTIV